MNKQKEKVAAEKTLAVPIPRLIDNDSNLDNQKHRKKRLYNAANPPIFDESVASLNTSEMM